VKKVTMNCKAATPLQYCKAIIACLLGFILFLMHRCNGGRGSN